MSAAENLEQGRVAKRLTPADFEALWDLGQYELWRVSEKGDRILLTPCKASAQESYMGVLSGSNNLCLGAFEDGVLVGAIIVTSHSNTMYRKWQATVAVWLGTIELIDFALAWVKTRPAIRLLSIAFDRDVPRGTYRLLRWRGFEKSGDVLVHWG